MPLVVIESMEEWDAALKKAGDEGKAVIADFHAVWCGPCKMIAPKYEALSVEHQEKVVALKVDVDVADDVAKQCKITAMPTFQMYKNGEMKDEMKGANEAKLISMFEEASKL